MCMDNLAYARIAYKSFSRSARHLMQLIGLTKIRPPAGPICPMPACPTKRA